MDIELFKELVGQLGIPAAFVFGLLWILSQVAKRISPLLEKSLISHNALVKTLSDTARENADSQQRFARACENTEKVIAAIHKHHTETVVHASYALEDIKDEGKTRKDVEEHTNRMRDGLKG